MAATNVKSGRPFRTNTEVGASFDCIVDPLCPTVCLPTRSSVSCVGIFGGSRNGEDTGLHRNGPFRLSSTLPLSPNETATDQGERAQVREPLLHVAHLGYDGVACFILS
jgi:hypothetical protein